MASPFKHISQIQSLADFQKLSKQVIGKLTEDPVKALYFPKFKFDKKEGPLLLIGDLPTPVLVEVKKAGGTPLIGQVSVNPADQLVFEGAIKPAMARAALVVLGIPRVVSSGGDDDGAEEEKEAEETKAPSAKTPVPPAPKPQTPPQSKPTTSGPKPPVPPPPSKPPITTAKTQPPSVKPPVPQVKPPTKPGTEKPGATKQEVPPPPPPKAPSEKEQFAQQMKTLFPLFQKACDAPGASEAELKQLWKTAADAATAKDFTAAMAAFKKLEAAVTETLAQASGATEEEKAESESEEEVTGEFARSRKAWQKAMREAAKSISALQAAVLKTKDPRATGLASGFKRILKKIPNPGPALDALAVAAEKKDKEAAAKHKAEITRLGKLCMTYLGTDRLVLLAVENPFVEVKIYDQFKSALQTMQTEIK